VCVCTQLHLPPISLGISSRLVGTSMAGLGSERFRDLRCILLQGHCTVQM
jgi:hypothetical protein